MTLPLPHGWTLERIRHVSGDETAVALPADQPATVWRPGSGYNPILPDLVLGFGALCLAHVADDGWYMGSIIADGSLSCWAYYGDDLYEALRGL